MNEDYLIHYGIIGQKWGVRRYQNEDGTYTEAGKKRYGSSGLKTSTLSDSQKKAIKTGAIAVGAAATVAAAAYAYSKNPTAIKSAVKTAIKNLKIANNADSLKNIINSETTTKGKKRLAKVLLRTLNAKNTAKGAVIKGVKVATTAAISGAAIEATRKMLDSMFGEEEADRMLENYNAYNKKAKIAYKNLRKNYEKYEQYDRDDDDDDDDR